MTLKAIGPVHSPAWTGAGKAAQNPCKHLTIGRLSGSFQTAVAAPDPRLARVEWPAGDHPCFCL